MSELMSEIMPGSYDTNRTVSFQRFMRMFKRKSRMRQRRQRECTVGYSKLQKWLFTQIAIIRKKKENQEEKCRIQQPSDPRQGENVLAAQRGIAYSYLKTCESQDNTFGVDTK